MIEYICILEYIEKCFGNNKSTGRLNIIWFIDSLRNSISTVISVSFLWVSNYVIYFVDRAREYPGFENSHSMYSIKL